MGMGAGQGPLLVGSFGPILRRNTDAFLYGASVYSLRVRLSGVTWAFRVAVIADEYLNTCFTFV